MMAVFAAMAVLVTAIIYSTVSFPGYNYRGYGMRPAVDTIPAALGMKFCSAQCTTLEPYLTGTPTER